jgi:hypothetical protein
MQKEKGEEYEGKWEHGWEDEEERNDNTIPEKKLC